jgi:hypothetical protein
MPWAPNLRSFTGICLEGLRKTTNDLSEDIQLSLNPDPHKCGGTRGSVVFKPRPEEVIDFFSIYLILPAVRRADNLTAICETMWDP